MMGKLGWLVSMAVVGAVGCAGATQQGLAQKAAEDFVRNHMPATSRTMENIVLSRMELNHKALYTICVAMDAQDASGTTRRTTHFLGVAMDSDNRILDVTKTSEGPKGFSCADAKNSGAFSRAF